ncbi:hypothetical protein H671_1g3675 [Cricetulus griseus]|nr:hypothetical protein H671_1g3675 [Cricetulus griseus]
MFLRRNLSLSSPWWSRTGHVYQSGLLTISLLDAGVKGVHHYTWHFVFLKFHSVHVCCLLNSSPTYESWVPCDRGELWMCPKRRL